MSSINGSVRIGGEVGAMRPWTPLHDVPATHRWHAPPEDVAACYREIAEATRFTFDASARIASAGSCFGGRIADRLRLANLRYVVAEPGPASIDRATRELYGYWPFSARYGFVYSSLQLAQLFERAFGLRTAHDTAWELGDRYVDPFRPRIQPGGYSSVAELLFDREAHFDAVRRVFRSLDVFVFTMGLSEVCVDLEDDMAFPLPPGVAGGIFEHSRYGFRNLTVAENVAYLHRFVELLASENPTAKVILSVSPVSVAATVSNRHIVRATTYSKSVLRVACEETVYLHPNVDYFPSYEMVSHQWSGEGCFEPGGRHVRSHIADAVVDTFMASYMPTYAASPVAATAPQTEIVHPFPCDDEVLYASVTTTSTETPESSEAVARDA